MKISGIYKIVSPTNKVYIGQSWDIKARWSQHRREKNPKMAVIRSLQKYGHESHSFSVLHILPNDADQMTMDRYEQVYIDYFSACGITMLNMKEAGSYGKMSIEVRKKMSIANTGRAAWNKGKSGMYIASQETREKISKVHKGKSKSQSTKDKMAEKARLRRHSEESKKKMSDIKMGRPNGRKGIPLSEEHKAKMHKWKIGDKHSEETKAKISANHSRHNKGKSPSEASKIKNRLAHLGKKASEETRMRMSISHQNRLKKPDTLVRLWELLKGFDSIAI